MNATTENVYIICIEFTIQYFYICIINLLKHILFCLNTRHMIQIKSFPIKEYYWE